MTLLSVNLDKIAYLRNSRRTGIPNLLKFANIVRGAGADGITVHPRPDERHVLRSDVLELSRWLQDEPSSFEFNVEGYPDERFLDLIKQVRPNQCTLVPDGPDVLTSEEGWTLGNKEIWLLEPIVKSIRALGCRVIVFLNPDPDMVDRVPATGADGIEIYTGGYAAAFATGSEYEMLQACTEAADRARRLGLVVNIGHDLNLLNLEPLVSAIPYAAEASIGHELTADALVMGFEATVAAYKSVLSGKSATS